MSFIIHIAVKLLINHWLYVMLCEWFLTWIGHQWWTKHWIIVVLSLDTKLQIALAREYLLAAAATCSFRQYEAELSHCSTWVDSILSLSRFDFILMPSVEWKWFCKVCGPIYIISDKWSVQSSLQLHISHRICFGSICFSQSDKLNSLLDGFWLIAPSRCSLCLLYDIAFHFLPKHVLE